MKKQKIKQITLGIIGGLILSTSVQASTTGLVNVENLNVRSEPSTTSSIIDYVFIWVMP